MAYALGTASGKITIDYDGAGVDKAKEDIGGLTEKSGDVEGAMRDVSNTMGAAGLAISGGLAVAVNTAANFEQRMSAVAAVSGATGGELDRLREKALQLGMDTAFGASESALAMEELVKAGLTVDEVLNGAADATVALAAAGEVDLAQAATIASAAMNSFGLQADEVNHVADIMAGAANASATGVAEIGDSFRYVAPLASSAGVSIDDTVTAIAALGDVGITGSQAGTTLRAMLTRLQPASAKAATAMKELGIITKDGSNRFFNANGSMKSMAQVAEILKGSLSGLSDQERTRALTTIFGANAMAGATAMAQKGAKGFNELNKVIQGTDASDVAAERMNNFKGSLEEMKGSLETAGIAIGTALIPGLRVLVDALGSAFDWFNSLEEGTQKFIAIGLAAVAGILLIGAAIMKIVIFIGQFRAALLVLRTAMATTWLTALGPIALVVAAVAAVVAIIILLWNKSETFRTIVIAVWNAIKTAVMAVVNWFMTLPAKFASVWNVIKTGMAVIKAVFVAAWNMIRNTVRTVINVIRVIITAGVNAWLTVVRSILNAIKAIFTAVWNVIKTVTKTTFTAIKTAISAGLNAAKAVVNTIINGIKTVVTGAWNAIKTTTTTVWNGIKNAVTTAIEGVRTAVNNVVDFIKGAFDIDLAAKGKAIIQSLIDGIGSMVNAAVDAVKNVVGKVKDLIPGSPVKTGPLTVLNRGHSGQEIVKMLISGIDDMAPALDAAMNAATAPLSKTIAAPVSGTGGRRVKVTPRPNNQGSKIVGELTLTKGSRAFIKGIAYEAVDENDEYADTIGRMG